MGLEEGAEQRSLPPPSPLRSTMAMIWAGGGACLLALVPWWTHKRREDGRTAKGGSVKFSHENSRPFCSCSSVSVLAVGGFARKNCADMCAALQTHHYCCCEENDKQMLRLITRGCLSFLKSLSWACAWLMMSASSSSELPTHGASISATASTQTIDRPRSVQSPHPQQQPYTPSPPTGLRSHTSMHSQLTRRLVRFCHETVCFSQNKLHPVLLILGEERR